MAIDRTGLVRTARRPPRLHGHRRREGDVCLLVVIDRGGRPITTIEGLARDGELDPVQQAFLDADTFQCGFCTPGQIMSLRALLDERPDSADEEIERAVSGNLCRRGAYLNIVEAGPMAAASRPARAGNEAAASATAAHR